MPFSLSAALHPLGKFLIQHRVRINGAVTILGVFFLVLFSSERDGAAFGGVLAAIVVGVCLALSTTTLFFSDEFRPKLYRLIAAMLLIAVYIGALTLFPVDLEAFSGLRFEPFTAVATCAFCASVLWGFLSVESRVEGKWIAYAILGGGMVVAVSALFSALRGPIDVGVSTNLLIAIACAFSFFLAVQEVRLRVRTLYLGCAFFFGAVLLFFLFAYVDTTPSIRPSFTSSMHVVLNQYAQFPWSLVFGIDRHSFSASWNLFSPDAVNLTSFWDQEFSSGYSLALSYAVSFGVPLVILALVYAITCVVDSFALLYHRVTPRGYMLAANASLIGVACSAFFDVPSTASLVLGGFLIGTVSGSSGSAEGAWFIRRNILNTWCAMILLVSAVGLCAMGLVRYRALLPYQQAEAALRADPQAYDTAADLLKKSISFEKIAFVARTYSSMLQKSIRFTVLSKESADLSDEEKDTLLTAADEARAYAYYASQVAPFNYKNWIARGDAESLSSQMKGDLSLMQLAKGSYEKASLQGKRRPLPLFLEAQTAAFLGDTEVATDRATHALILKPDFTDAVQFLAEIRR